MSKKGNKDVVSMKDIDKDEDEQLVSLKDTKAQRRRSSKSLKKVPTLNNKKKSNENSKVAVGIDDNVSQMIKSLESK